jgi:hypothetical protein
MVYVTKSVPQFKEAVEIEEAKSVKVKTRTGSDKYDYDELLPEVQKIVIMSKAVPKKNRMDVAKKITKAIIAGKIKNPDISSDLATLIGVDQPYPGAAPRGVVKDQMKKLKLESAEIEEGFYYDAMSPKDKKRLNNIYKEMDKNEKQSQAAIKKGDAKTVDKLGKEYHKLRMQVVNFYNESVEVEESVELEEATMSQGVKTAAKHIYSLEQSLKVGSKLNKGVNKSLEGKYDADFKTMEKGIGQIINVWEEIERDYAMNESTDFEKTNTLTSDEYDEVQNFQNFNKKDWRWLPKQGKYVRKKKV